MTFSHTLLENLVLFCSVTRSGLNQLNGLSRLRSLQVSLPGNNTKRNTADELMLDLSGLTNMKDLSLSGLQLQDDDLAFIEHMPSLENLMIQPDSPLSGAFLRYLTELSKLNHLYVSGLSHCTGEDLANLSTLPKLRGLNLKGDITDSALASLTGPPHIDSLYVDTDEPISKQTVTDLAKAHPVIEYIHISEPPKTQTRPVRAPKRPMVNRPRTNLRQYRLYGRRRRR